jgi:hypothetical protein
MTGETVADLVRARDEHLAGLAAQREIDTALSPPSLLRAAAGYVDRARREEVALARKVDTGIFGAEAAGRPWPGHDAALCRSYEYEAQKAWLYAVTMLLDALNGGRDGQG